MEDATGGIRITVLGSVRAFYGDDEVALGPPRQRAVFAHLALHVNKPVLLDALVASVWGSHPARRGEELVRTYVARLRRALEPCTPPRSRTHVIASVPGGYRLHADPDRVDVSRFSRLVVKARAFAEADDEARAFECYGDAVQLWPDPPLTELGGGLLPGSRVVEALRREWLTAGLAYTTLGLRLGRAAVVLPHAELMAAVEPLEEPVQAAYFSALASTGQRAAAVHHYTGVRTRLRVELGVEPGAELTRVYHSLLHEQPAAAAPPVSGATRPRWYGPGPTVGPLIGRRPEVAALAALLAANRLLTVVGPAGCGKSADALAVAEEVRSAFPDGVAVLELSEVADHAEVLSRLGATLGGVAVTDPVRLFADGRRLLVLDNVEHLADTVAALVDGLMRGCRDLSVLVTSRKPLALPGEVVRRIGPLRLPAGDDPATLGENPAVRFFVQRAAQVSPGFRLQPDNAAALAWICQQLDGLPLALELAAACLYTDTLTELLHRVADPLHRLHPQRRGHPVHHRSLHRALRRSVDLLGPAERRLLLLVGNGPREFTLDTARRRSVRVVAADDVPGLLDRLTNHSLLERRSGPEGLRYRMLRLTHRMAAALAAADGPGGPPAAHLFHGAPPGTP